MVKAKKKKKKKKAKEKVSQNMFVKGGLYLLILGGIIAIFYQTLYLLITVESQIEDVSYRLFLRIFQGIGVLLVFFAIVFVSFYFLKENEFFKRHTGSLLIAGAALSVPPVVASLYEIISLLKEGQTLTAQSFLSEIFPRLMDNISRIYIFAGAVFLGIFLWGYRHQRNWAAQFFIGGAAAGCAALVASMYAAIETYNVIIETYGDVSKELIISRVVFPELLKSASSLLVITGVLLLSASYLWKRYRFRKWAGRTWVFGGIAGAFYGFINLGLNSQMIQEDITRVRQAVMDLTPYTTYLKEQILTVETLKEFYAKKMIPSYMDNAMWIAVFAAIALFGIYLWTKE